MLRSSLGFWAIQSPVAGHPSGIGHGLPLRVYVLELFSPFKSIANYELFCKYVYTTDELSHLKNNYKYCISDTSGL